MLSTIGYHVSCVYICKTSDTYRKRHKVEESRRIKRSKADDERKPFRRR